MRTALIATVTAAAGLLAAACSHNVYTPPSRAFPLETPSVLPAGKYGVQIEASGHGKSPDVGAGTLRVRRGVDEDVELTAEATYARAGNATAAGTNPNLFALRAGARFHPDELRALGVTAGLGGGTFAGGPFITADAGAVLAYDSCRLTPFVGGSGYISKPIDPRAVDSTEAGMPAGMFVDTPETTTGIQVRVGLKLNLSSCERRSTAVVVGFGLDHFWDDDSDRGLASGGAALEINLE